MSPGISQQPVSAVTVLTDPAAEAAIHAACRIQQLPPIRAEAARWGDAAVKQRPSHKAFLVEVLTRYQGPVRSRPEPYGARRCKRGGRSRSVVGRTGRGGAVGSW
jgi:hypothetical protein